MYKSSPFTESDVNIEAPCLQSIQIAIAQSAGEQILKLGKPVNKSMQHVGKL